MDALHFVTVQMRSVPWSAWTTPSTGTKSLISSCRKEKKKHLQKCQSRLEESPLENLSTLVQNMASTSNNPEVDPEAELQAHLASIPRNRGYHDNLLAEANGRFRDGNHNLEQICNKFKANLQQKLKQISKNRQSSDWRLKLAYMKSESLVIVNHHVTVNDLSNFAHTAHHARRVVLAGHYLFFPR